MFQGYFWTDESLERVGSKHKNAQADRGVKDRHRMIAACYEKLLDLKSSRLARVDELTNLDRLWCSMWQGPSS